MITLRNLYDLALALMGEDPQKAATYDSLILPLANLLLCELFDAENSRRQSTGREALSEIPVLMGLDELIPYDDCLVRGAMPYGLAGRFMLDEDIGKANFFAAEYAFKKAYYTMAAPEAILDVYGGSE